MRRLLMMGEEIRAQPHGGVMKLSSNVIEVWCMYNTYPDWRGNSTVLKYFVALPQSSQKLAKPIVGDKGICQLCPNGYNRALVLIFLDGDGHRLSNHA